MSRKVRALIRAFLKALPDGATRREISLAVNPAETAADLSAIRCAVKAMPDVYVDRWIQRPGCRAEAVHVCVVVPEDCPPPDLIGRRTR